MTSAEEAAVEAKIAQLEHQLWNLATQWRGTFDIEVVKE
jgi:hypothetical protein